MLLRDECVDTHLCLYAAAYTMSDVGALPWLSSGPSLSAKLRGVGLFYHVEFGKEKKK